MRGGVGVTVAFALLEGRDSDSASREVMILHESPLLGRSLKLAKKKKKLTQHLRPLSVPTQGSTEIGRELDIWFDLMGSLY